MRPLKNCSLCMSKSSRSLSVFRLLVCLVDAGSGARLLLGWAALRKARACSALRSSSSFWKEKAGSGSSVGSPGRRLLWRARGTNGKREKTVTSTCRDRVGGPCHLRHSPADSSPSLSSHALLRTPASSSDLSQLAVGWLPCSYRETSSLKGLVFGVFHKEGGRGGGGRFCQDRSRRCVALG